MRYLLTFTSGLLVLTMLCIAMPFAAEGELYDQFVRLHVLANSDSEADQTVKMAVRDAVVEKTASLTAGCTDVRQALAVLESNAAQLAQTANGVLLEKGFDYGARVVIGQEYYPTREYEEVTLPAGVYRSARIILGDGEGKNWWCILFPPLCTDAAKARDKLKAAGFTSNQIRILTDSDDVTYKLKFRSLEILSGLLEQLKAVLG